MIVAFFIGLFFTGVGVLIIFLGKKAQNDRVIYNSGKSALVTGIKKIEGDWAVRLGKIYVYVGFGFIGVGSLILLSSFLYILVTSYFWLVGSPFRPTMPLRHSAIHSKSLYDFPSNGKGYQSRTAGGVFHFVEYEDGKVIRDIKTKVGTKTHREIKKEIEDRRAKTRPSNRRPVDSQLTRSTDRKNWFRSKRARQKAKEKNQSKKSESKSRTEQEENPFENTQKKSTTEDEEDPFNPKSNKKSSKSLDDEDPFNPSGTKSKSEKEDEEDPFNPKPSKKQNKNSIDVGNPFKTESERKAFEKSEFGTQFQSHKENMETSLKMVESMDNDAAARLQKLQKSQLKQLQESLIQQWRLKNKDKK